MALGTKEDGHLLLLSIFYLYSSDYTVQTCLCEVRKFGQYLNAWKRELLIPQCVKIVCNIFSWREARSSICRLVTGTVAQAAQVQVAPRRRILN